MAGVRFTDVQARPTEFLDLTSVTLEEFQQLMPPFEAAFQAHMAAWRLDGKPRTARQCAVYKNCPLPTPEDRLFFLLTYLKTYALQVVQGRLFGMGQSKANQWIHVLLPALQAALRTLGDTPARSLTALAQRLGVSETDAAIVVAPLEEEPPPVAPTSSAPAAGQASRLVPMTAPNGASSTPKTLLNRRRVRAARKRTTRCTMACWPMLPSRSSFSARRLEAASMRSTLPTQRRIPCRRGVGYGRIWASWRARFPRRNPHADAETTRPGSHPGGATGQPGPALSPVTDRACAQQCQALSHRQRPDPPLEAGRP